MADSNPPFQRMESLRIASSTSFEDRTGLVHGELYREIKRKLNCILAERIIKQLRVEIRIDQDVFDKQKVCYNL